MKKTILLQIDHDPRASSFDSIVAYDAGVDRLLTFAGMTPIDLEPIIHGCMFTRGPQDLCQTAIFFGGSHVDKTMELFTAAQRCFFGPLRVSVMADPNGCNTTAAAAIICAQRHIKLREAQVTVLAGTGPVGQRIGLLAASLGAQVLIGSRNLQRAAVVAKSIQAHTGTSVQTAKTDSPDSTRAAIQTADVVFAAGAAGVELLESGTLPDYPNIQVALDVNATPPLGIADIQLNDCGQIRNSSICYGAIGVGQFKMKIHKRCIARLFESNDAILDTEQIFQLASQLSDHLPSIPT